MCTHKGRKCFERMCCVCGILCLWAHVILSPELRLIDQQHHTQLHTTEASRSRRTSHPATGCEINVCRSPRRRRHHHPDAYNRFVCIADTHTHPTKDRRRLCAPSAATAFHIRKQDGPVRLCCDRTTAESRIGSSPFACVRSRTFIIISRAQRVKWRRRKRRRATPRMQIDFNVSVGPWACITKANCGKTLAIRFAECSSASVCERLSIRMQRQNAISSNQSCSSCARAVELRVPYNLYRSSVDMSTHSCLRSENT